MASNTKDQNPNPLPLGDAVKKLADKLGIEQCGGCAKRQKVLNDAGRKIASVFTGKKKK